MTAITTKPAPKRLALAVPVLALLFFSPTLIAATASLIAPMLQTGALQGAGKTLGVVGSLALAAFPNELHLVFEAARVPATVSLALTAVVALAFSYGMALLLVAATWPIRLAAVAGYLALSASCFGAAIAFLT